MERPYPFGLLLAIVVALAVGIGLLREGDAPLQATNPAPALWYDNSDRLGDSLGRLATGIMGVPPPLHIATVIQNSQTTRRHDCLTRRCAEALENGLARLPRPLPGAPVIEGVRSCFRHSDYLAAHGAALADPQLRFAFPGDRTPAAPESGLRMVVIVLPSEIAATPPRQGHVPPTRKPCTG